MARRALCVGVSDASDDPANQARIGRVFRYQSRYIAKSACPTATQVKRISTHW